MTESLKPIIGRFGGKTKLKKRIVDDYFIKDYQDMTYVEPFVGGGSIFFYKEKSKKEVINDLDKDVIIVYRGVKKYDANDIENAINGAYTKSEFDRIKASTPNTEFKKFIRDFILYKTSYYLAGKTFGGDRTVNKNMDGYKERLKDVTILNEDYKNVIKKYDSINTFFYLDPPYEKSDGLYKNEDSTIDEIYNILKDIKGKFLLSYNLSKRAQELFKNYKIYKIKTKYETNRFNNKPTSVTELLISNY